MDQIKSVIEKITRLKFESADSWPSTVGMHFVKRQIIEGWASACDQEYQNAINALNEGDLDRAMIAIDRAWVIENEGGDVSHAHEARQAISAYQQDADLRALVLERAVKALKKEKFEVFFKPGDETIEIPILKTENDAEFVKITNIAQKLGCWAEWTKKTIARVGYISLVY